MISDRSNEAEEKPVKAALQAYFDEHGQMSETLTSRLQGVKGDRKYQLTVEDAE